LSESLLGRRIVGVEGGPSCFQQALDLPQLGVW
jgi:hypothetical protein